MQGMKEGKNGQADSNGRSAQAAFGAHKQDAVLPKVDRLVALLDAWKEFSAIDDWGPEGGKRIFRLSTGHSMAFRLLCGKKFNQDDLDRFCLALKSYEDVPEFASKAGIFLSAMVNIGEEREYTITTGHLATPLHHLGAFTDKKVIVRGDAGDHAGDHRIGGDLFIEGNSGHSVGSDMEGGTIFVKGHVGASEGCGMKGGEIIVLDILGRRSPGWTVQGTIVRKGEPHGGSKG